MTKKVPSFVPEPVKINDNDEELEQCITEIKCRMKIIDSTTGSNEAVRCKYVFPILYTSGFIARKITKKGIPGPQFEMADAGRVDYAVIDVVS